ncbi:hypothetical protein ABDF71_21740 [Ochrobactrum sp. WV_118_8]
MNRRTAASCEHAGCDHNWLNHYSAENGDLPDARLCTTCGEFEQTESFGRPTRFPDLRDQLTNQSLIALDTVERAPWHERVWSKVLRGYRNLVDFVFFRN